MKARCGMVEKASRAVALFGVGAALLATGVAPALAAVNRPPYPAGRVIDPEALPQKEVEGACGVAVDPGGVLYLSDYYHNAVEAFAPYFGIQHRYSKRVSPESPNSGPCGIATGPDGAIFVNNYHQNVVRFAPGLFGAATTFDSNHSTGVAVDPSSGDVYVDDRTYVAVYEPSGAPVLAGGEALRIGEGTLGDAYGVAVAGSSGLVYVPDAADGLVKVYDPSGDPSVPVAVIDGVGTPQKGFVSLRDSAIAVDQSNGHVLILDNLQPGFEHPEGVVDEFNAVGAYRGQLSRPFVDGEPSGLAYDEATGNVYLTDGNSEGADVIAFGPASPAYSLSVEKLGAGTGTVISAPNGIRCGSACEAEFDAGSTVSLTAVPDAGSAFAGFAGGCTGTGSCNVTLSAATTVTAQFEQAPQAVGSSVSSGRREGVAVAPAPAAGAASSRLASSVGAQGSTIWVTAPGPGTIAVSGLRLRSSAPRSVSAGPLSLRLHLNRSGRLILAHSKRGELRVRTSLTFTSRSGEVERAHPTVDFERRGGGRR